jgi:hypothetical protein
VQVPGLPPFGVQRQLGRPATRRQLGRLVTRADHRPLVASARARARVGTVTTMDATATPNPPAGVSLIELALEAGYAFRDQRWRLHAACAGVDPEVFLPTRASRSGRRCPTAAGVKFGPRVWKRRSISVSRRSGCGGTSAQQRRIAKRSGWDAVRLLEELG